MVPMVMVREPSTDFAVIVLKVAVALRLVVNQAKVPVAPAVNVAAVRRERPRTNLAFVFIKNESFSRCNQISILLWILIKYLGNVSRIKLPGRHS